MDDNQQLNEAYYSKANEGISYPHDETEMREGFKNFMHDNDLNRAHPGIREIEQAYREGFMDAKNVYWEAEDDWETRY